MLCSELRLLLLSVERSTHQRLHHVGLTVAESLNGVKDVHHVLVLNHLQQDVTGAEGPAAAAAVSAGGPTTGTTWPEFIHSG